MADYRNRHDNDQFGFDVQEGLGFSFNRSGVREFIRADRQGVVTHRLFIYQNGSSPGQIVLDEGEALTSNLPLTTPVWQELGNAPERRGLGAIPRRGASGRAGGGGGAASGGAGGVDRYLRRSAAGTLSGPPPSVLARGSSQIAGTPALTREENQIEGTPLIARTQIAGTPLLAEDPRHRYRHKTRKNKQK
jgi:hypothetical protein